MGSFWETFWGEDEIEMPPEAARPDAVTAARAAADAAHADAAALDAAADAALDNWSNALKVGWDARADAAAKAGKVYDPEDAAAYRSDPSVVAADATTDTFSAIHSGFSHAADDAHDAAKLADAAVEATRAIDEGWHKAKAIADLEDAAGDARAASTAAWNDVTKAIADGDPDALEDALDASKLADAAAEATRAVADGYHEAAPLDAPAAGSAYDQEHLVEDVSGGFEEVGEDIWTDGF